MQRCRMSIADHEELWRRRRRGETYAAIGRAVGRTAEAVFYVVRRTGGVAPRPRRRAAGTLTRTDREEVSRGLAAGCRVRRLRASCTGPPPRSRGRSSGMAAAGSIAAIGPMRALGRAPVGPSRVGWRGIPACGRWSPASWRATGRRNRLPAGCARSTRIIRPCTSRTRRSISVSLCKRAGSSNASCSSICGADVVCGAPELGPCTTPSASSMPSRFESGLPVWKTARYPGIGKATYSAARHDPTSRRSSSGTRGTSCWCGFPGPTA